MECIVYGIVAVLVVAILWSADNGKIKRGFAAMSTERVRESDE